ncbi:hypothetical protein [Arthrobacter sp. M4]|uniref:hypothetical protein n=1 Tax=Arthrobacter sp. M4 TaxID=218160 RepID=UPI001CDC9E8F|nr:hypothetical protein [Arthrobacter sp. M4]MCA4134387.1 hypothetical protein [Arthrobacter sp. M4]
MARAFGGRRMVRSRSGIFGAVYLAIGVVVAATHGYFVGWNIPGNVVEALMAIVLWPVVAILGIDFHALIP